MDLRVPTLQLEAELNYAGDKLIGTVFLPTLSPLHAGNQRPDEWINQSTTFFPFLIRGRERAVILNKRKVLLMRLRRTDEINIRPEEEAYACAVQVECDDRHLEGILLIEMPSGQGRVLDAVNQPDRYLPLWDAESLYLIRKSFIRIISEVDRA
jgi:hypothetical protein